MASDNFKWVLGGVIVPVGLSLAVSGVSLASFKGAQEVKNTSFESEILEVKKQLAEEMKQMNEYMKDIAVSQKNVEERQIALVIKAELREKDYEKLYSEFKDVRDSVLLLQQSKTQL